MGVCLHHLDDHPISTHRADPVGGYVGLLFGITRLLGILPGYSKIAKSYFIQAETVVGQRHRPGSRANFTPAQCLGSNTPSGVNGEIKRIKIDNYQ